MARTGSQMLQGEENGVNKAALGGYEMKGGRRTKKLGAGSIGATVSHKKKGKEKRRGLSRGVGLNVTWISRTTFKMWNCECPSKQ